MDLAPGFRFYPTEEELVSFYLHNKLEGKRKGLNQAIDRVIPVLDLYDFNPWELPQLSGELCRADPEQWFFFIPRQENEICGGRPNRLTTTGYWKSTGSPGFVYSSNNLCIGHKRTMVFYEGRVPNGRKTDWKMNDYKAIQIQQDASNPLLSQEFSLCRVYKTTSNCRRSFDRRPIERIVPQIFREEARTTNPNLPIMVEQLTSSAPQNYHGGPTSKIEGDLNKTKLIDDEPLWDWEDLYNWDTYMKIN